MKLNASFIAFMASTGAAALQTEQSVFQGGSSLRSNQNPASSKTKPSKTQTTMSSGSAFQTKRPEGQTTGSDVEGMSLAAESGQSLAQGEPLVDQTTRLQEDTEHFIVKEGELQYQNSNLATPNVTELLYLDMAIVQAYNDVNTDDSFRADVAQVTDMVHDRRYLRMLPGTNWGGAVRIGGRCTFCPNRLLMTDNDAALALRTLEIINSGPFEIFHTLSDLEIYI